ncbi:unnamed protein product [Paramecium pentaurelia]|uniref:Uncharacterized protein n=1 Tax=Paramecium pentaurelia TaxID=43138 RepID=A0A8S1SNP6_9CILI|nr:unnamed protein product [Paramecium pentaurelia]
MWNYTPASKICHMRTQMEAYDKHLYSVRNAKSIVKTTTPYKPYFLSRNNEINKCNSILFDKILDIDIRQGDLSQSKMKQKFKLNSTSRQSTNRNRGLSIDLENSKISDRIQSAKSQYSKQRQLRHSSQFERYSKNISQNARRSSHYDFKQLLLSKSFEHKLKKPLLRSSYVSSQNQYSEPSPYYSENPQVYF